MGKRVLCVAGILAAVIAASCTSTGRRASTPEDTPTPLATSTRVPLYSEGFEAGSGGWSAGAVTGANSSWAVSAPAIPAPYQGSQVFGTSGAGGGYYNGENSHAMSPPWSLASGSSYTFRCQHWYALDLGYDAGRAEYTTNAGAAWAPLTPSPGYPTNVQYTGNAGGWPIGTPCYSGVASGWAPMEIPLAPYAGSTVRLRFRLSTDSSVSSTGWYLDEVTVQ